MSCFLNHLFYRNAPLILFDLTAGHKSFYFILILFYYQIYIQMLHYKYQDSLRRRFIECLILH